jgi:hypothetical protein
MRGVIVEKGLAKKLTVIRAAGMTFITALFVVHFVLLSFKLDAGLQTNHLVVFIPVGLGHFAVAIVLSVVAIVTRRTKRRVWCFSGLMVVMGSMISQLLLSLKSDMLIRITYFLTMVPFSVSVILGSLIALICAD